MVSHSALLWMLVRLLFFLFLWLIGGLSVALDPTSTTRVFLVAVAAFLVWWDRRRAHELLLPANLGVWPGWFWAASLLTASMLDLTLQRLIEVL